MSEQSLNTTARTESIWKFLSRLADTPVSDVLRGRIAPPQQTLEEIIAAAELPALISQLVKSVVVKSKLWRREQVEVIRELISHFKEGIECGATVEQLVDNFGDSVVAAKLIRRSKKRNRSLIHRSTVRASQAFGLFVAILLVTYGFFAFRVFCYSPTLRYNFTAEHNSRVAAIPENQRAWPLYREAALRFGPSLIDIPREITPYSSTWPKLVAYAVNHQDAVSLFREAASRPHFGRLLTNQIDEELERLNPDSRLLRQPSRAKTENPSLISVYLPELSVLGRVCNLLQIDAYAAAASSNSNVIFSDMKAMLRMAEHANASHFVISDLTAINILSLTCDLMNRVLYTHPNLLDDFVCIGLAHELASALGGGTLRLRLDGARELFLDFLQRDYNDDGDGDGHAVWPDESITLGFQWSADEALMLPIMSFLDAGRKKNLAKYDELFAITKREAETPLWKRSDSIFAQAYAENLNGSWDQYRYRFVRGLVASFSDANYRAEIATQRRDATLTVIALELYKRKNGTWPQSLADLVPQFLPAVPPDRFDGQPLKYKLVDGKPLLYSVGADRRDDDGHLPRGKAVKANQMTSRWCPPEKVKEYLKAKLIEKGDWILWPPVD